MQDLESNAPLVKSNIEATSKDKMGVHVTQEGNFSCVYMYSILEG